MPARALRRWIALAVFAAPPVAAAEPLRIHDLQRCGDLLAQDRLEYCVEVAGDYDRVMLGGTLLPAAAVQAQDRQLRLRLERGRWRSGPLWLQRGAERSNAVWLSLQPSHVLAAGPDEVAKNSDGITSYVDLVSVIFEEEYDAPAEASRIAAKFNARLVGAIPPLRTYQLRLPVTNLIERDALVLRIGGEESVDGVVIEESSPEEGAGDAAAGRAEEELAANRFADAIDYYRRRLPGAGKERIEPASMVVGVVERDVDFDLADFAPYLKPPGDRALRLYARDAAHPDGHGSIVAGQLAADWDDTGNGGLLRALDGRGGGFTVIVERDSDAGVTANIAASVNLVEDGARVLNWSWGVHRIGAERVGGGDVDSLVRSGVAVGGYEELMEAFFMWLRRKHPQVIVVNSAGNGASFAGDDDYRLPSSFITDQLLVVAAHQRSGSDVAVAHPDYAKRRRSSNLDRRVDIAAAGCVRAPDEPVDSDAKLHCGTSYATAVVTATVAAMLSINPALKPAELRQLLRRSAMPIGEERDFEPVDAEDLTAPIVPSERAYLLHHPDVGRSARLDIRRALELAVDSLSLKPGQ